MNATDNTSDQPMTEDMAVDAIDRILTGDTGDQDEAEGEQQATEAEDAPAEDAEGQEADDPDQQEDDTDSYTVKVDGQDVTVTLDELTRGYSRTADYTRKTQELAQQRKAAEAELSLAKAERAHYQENLTKVMAQIQQQAPQEPDWIRLANENPADYVRQRAQWDVFQSRLRELEQEQRQVSEREEADEAKALAAKKQTEMALMLEAIPAWKDPKKLAEGSRALEAFVKQVGFTPDELNLGDVNDHRIIVLLHEAMMYRKLKSQGAAKQAGLPVQPQSKQGSSKRVVTDQTRAKMRFAQTRSAEDAAAALAHMFQ